MVQLCQIRKLLRCVVFERHVKDLLLKAIHREVCLLFCRITSCLKIYLANHLTILLHRWKLRFKRFCPGHKSLVALGSFLVICICNFSAFKTFSMHCRHGFLISFFWGILATISGTNAGVEDKDYHNSRLCLICGGAEIGLNVFVLRAPEHLNGRIQHDLATVHSSVPIINDQEGEQNTPSPPHPFSAFISCLRNFSSVSM